MSRTALLPYAAKPPLLRRTRARTAVWLATFIAIVMGGVLWGRPAANKVRLLYWQSRCMGYSSSHPGIATPVEWTRFHEMTSGSGVLDQGTLFLHQRCSQGGRRLVVVGLYSGCFSQSLIARVFVPGSLFSRPKEVNAFLRHGIEIPFDAVFQHGQPDPRDDSHFTIHYEAGGVAHVIDGWLTDDDKVLLEPRRRVASATASP